MGVKRVTTEVTVKILFVEKQVDEEELDECIKKNEDVGGYGPEADVIKGLLDADDVWIEGAKCYVGECVEK